MRVCFRFDDVFPPGDAVSQFLVGLCMAVNDVTLSIKNDATLSEQGTAGERNYSLYLMCAYYREAAKFLHLWLEDEQVAAFLEDLSADDRQRLAKLRKSFTPWNGSFVQNSVKPAPAWNERRIAGSTSSWERGPIASRVTALPMRSLRPTSTRRGGPRSRS